MYRCELCALVPEFKGRGPKVAPPGQKLERVIVEQRPAEYPSRPKAQRRRIGRKLKNFDDPGGAGYEIAREAIACPTCADEYRKMKAASPDFDEDPELA